MNAEKTGETTENEKNLNINKKQGSEEDFLTAREARTNSENFMSAV